MSVKLCTVCNRCSKNDKQVRFFIFPGDKQRRLKWLEAINRLDLVNKMDNCKTRGIYNICEVHFENKYVMKPNTSSGRRILTKDAIPTLRLNAPAVVVPMTSENFLNPPNPLRYTQNTKWEDYHTAKYTRRNSNQNSKIMKKEIKSVMPERRSVRQNIMAQKNNILNNNELSRVKRPSTPPSLLPFDDISQFCESVMRVSKGTQTFLTENNSIKLENCPQVTIKKMKTENTTNMTSQTFLEMCSKSLPPSLSKVIKWYMSTSNGIQNIHCTLFAINLYYSGNVYNLLRDMLGLPDKDALKYFLLPKSTKLNDSSINAFKCKVNNMSTREKICSFSVGSILLKPHLYYDIKHDRIIGLHDINGEQNISVAKYAVVLMVQGIVENWRQPIAYAFISEYDDSPDISAWIDETLTTLTDIGLNIQSFASDPCSEFLYASESRLVTPEKTSFTFNGTEIFYTYDATKLRKIVKNNFKSCNFDIGLDSKINEDDFFQKLDNLCNMLDSKTQFSNSPYKRAFSNKNYQRNFLNEMLHLFKNLKVVRKADRVDVTHHMKFIEGFQITIRSVLQLFDKLSFLGVKHLLTSHINHSSLKIFFTKVKLCDGKDEGTPRQFHKLFVRYFVFNLLKKPLGSNKNSLESEYFSQQLLDDEFQEINTEENRPLLVHSTDYRQGLPEKNAFVYVCGYCYLKCMQRHSCDTFRSHLNSYQSRQHVDNDMTFICSVNLALNVMNCEMVPPNNFVEYLMLLEVKIKEYLRPDVIISHVGQEILKELENYNFDMPCPCFPIDYLRILFLRVRLYYTIRKNNKLFKRRKNVKTLKVFSL